MILWMIDDSVVDPEAFAHAINANAHGHSTPNLSVEDEVEVGSEAVDSGEVETGDADDGSEAEAGGGNEAEDSGDSNGGSEVEDSGDSDGGSEAEDGDDVVSKPLGYCLMFLECFCNISSKK